MYGGLTLRPYQLLCLFCAQAGDVPGCDREEIKRAADAICQRPDLPLTLRCLAQDVYAYQDTTCGRDARGPRNGGVADRPSTIEFERKRDLDVLQRLDLPPGITLPARTLLHRVRKGIASSAGLCGYEQATLPAWEGCPLAFSGQYERGLAFDLSCLVPARSEEEMAADKVASVSAMRASDALRIRPHVMMCAVCNYGAKEGRPEPLAADNIVEFIEIIRERPDDVAIVMAPGADWMICAPCPQRVPEMNACVNVAGSGGLSNEKRDLDLLQVLGLQYEDALPAREMLRLLFHRGPCTAPICARDNPDLSVWWDGCGEANCTTGNPGYEAGRRLLMDELQL